MARWITNQYGSRVFRRQLQGELPGVRGSTLISYVYTPSTRLPQLCRTHLMRSRKDAFLPYIKIPTR